MARKKKKPAFTVDVADAGEDTFTAVFEMLLADHAEAGIVPLNASKTAEVCYRTLDQGMSLVARDATGAVIGSMGIVREQFWYSDTEFLRDVWLYVTPAWRSKNVGTMLMTAARAVADAHSLFLFITIANPKRRVKPTPMGIIAQEAGYIPVGYTFRRA